MHDILLQVEHLITKASDAIWPVFLPFILVVGAIMSVRSIVIIQKKATEPAKLNMKNVIGPASISLGAMIGTGAIIGVLGALSKLSSNGQANIEAMAVWALIGSLIMLPVSYSETLNSKIMGKTPKEYIGDLINPKLGILYAVCFVALAVFGFGGFQFSGIDSVAATIMNNKFGVELSLVQRYLFIVVPVILVVGAKNNMLIIDIVGLATQPSTKNLMKDEGTPKREYFNHYKLAGAKTWLDGSPQGFTAWLSKPYYKVPQGQPKDYCGYGTQTDEVVTQYFVDCINMNVQVHVHVNGDEACEQFLRCYEKAVEITGHGTELRPVMVHCQALRYDQLDRVKALGAIPTFFNDHVRFWGDLHHDEVFGPERAQNISPMGWALEKGIRFTIHQDPPVKLPNQILAIHNAVNRKTESGRVLGEHQRISVMEAIKAVTINGAYQYFEEDTKGSIEVGKIADLVILDKNPLSIDKEEIENIKVLETIKDGNTIFKA